MIQMTKMKKRVQYMRVKVMARVMGSMTVPMMVRRKKVVREKGWRAKGERKPRREKVVREG